VTRAPLGGNFVAKNEKFEKENRLGRTIIYFHGHDEKESAGDIAVNIHLECWDVVHE
jgi:hypothetical protein